MRRARFLTGALLTVAASLLAFAGPAAADDQDAEQKAPTEAGTSFRTATPFEQGQKPTASASTGDYLYWSFPADAGQRPTVRADVKLPDAQTRHGAQTWRLDVYDGLRRRQSCMYGMQARTVGTDAADVRLACTMRPVRAGSEAWADDPLRGTYYVRLTVTSLDSADLGLPVSAALEAESKDLGGAVAVDGALSKPLVSPGTTDNHDWSSTWWSSRWIWTAAGAALAALAGIGGYVATRPRRP
jgi:hypothetical protein